MSSTTPLGSLNAKIMKMKDGIREKEANLKFD